MDIVVACLLLTVGLVILWKCAELLVSGAVGLSKQFGVSPLIIGLTLFAMGTSSPEASASIVAAVRGMGDVAIGNVYGSNIANLALVGGLVALIRPMGVKRQTLQCEIPVMVFVAFLLWPMLSNGWLSRLEGCTLLIVFASVMVVMLYMEKRKEAKRKRKTRSEIRDVKKNGIYVFIGLVGLALGAYFMVEGAVSIGELIGLSDAVIGLTIIAIGTSLPELATCVVAALNGHSSIAIGNLVGSNIFNTLLVTGMAGLIGPFQVTNRLAGGAYYWIMFGISLGFAVVIVACRRVIGRIGGVILLCGYIAYMIYLFSFGS
jgi:cation:H+ antiporter